VEQRTWSGLQREGGSFFQNFVVHGGPYYISDLQRSMLVSGGMVCDGVLTYECYKMFADGVYLFRLGAGLFGTEYSTYPTTNAYWSGCGVNGTDRYVSFASLRFGSEMRL
jgi:hypothetical protein